MSIVFSHTKGRAFACLRLPQIVESEPLIHAQHYGLTRARLLSGRYEPVRIGHSWNANWMATSAVTFRLQRHADHHMFGSKPYQVDTSAHERNKLQHRGSLDWDARGMQTKQAGSRLGAVAKAGCHFRQATSWI